MKVNMSEVINFLKDFFLSVYQVFFLDAKERYSITEVYLEKCERVVAGKNI